MTGLEKLRAFMVQAGKTQGLPLVDAAIALAGQAGELSTLRALVDVAAQSSVLAGDEERGVVMEAFAENGAMIATAHAAIRAGRTVSLKPVPDWAGVAAGRA